jgi:hypothetical protein
MDNNEFIVSDTRINVSSAATDPLSILGKVFVGYVVSDRYGILNDNCYLRMHNDKTVHKPVRDNASNSFTELMNARAIALLKQYESIAVICMKGNTLDIAVLSAILSLKTKKNTISVYITDYANRINPELIQYVNTFDVDARLVNDADLWDDVGESECDLILTPFGGMYFVSGFQMLHRQIGDCAAIASMSWRDALPSVLFDTIRLEKSLVPSIEEACLRYAEYFGVELKNFNTLARLISWGLTRQQTAYVSKTKLADYPINRDKAISFFDDESFDRWVLDKLDDSDYPVSEQLSAKVLADYTKSVTDNQELIVAKFPYFKPESKSIRVFTNNGFKKFTLTNGSLTCKTCLARMCNRINQFFKKETND